MTADDDDAPRAARDDAPPRIAIGTRRSPDEPAWTRLLSPLRSEGAAFRALLIVAAAAAALAVVVLIARAL